LSSARAVRCWVESRNELRWLRPPSAAEAAEATRPADPGSLGARQRKPLPRRRRCP
ncbi:hypothetical protein BAE44_0008633, partial [Dichanthelium oligosanthes]